jgi:hypothetical protein
MFVLMNQVHYNEGAPQSVKDLMKEFDVFTLTIAIMRKGQENGTIREGDPYALGIAYWCAIKGIAEMVALNPKTPCPKGDWITDMIRGK